MPFTDKRPTIAVPLKLTLLPSQQEWMNNWRHNFLSIWLKHLADINTILYLSVGQIPFPFCIKSPLLTSWSRLPLEKLTLAHLIKPFSGFHDPEGSRPLSQIHQLVHILKQMDTIHVLLYPQVVLISSHLHLGLADYLPTLGFLQKLCIPLSSAMRVTFPAKFILDLNILIMCSEGHRSWSFTFCKFSCLLVHFRFTTILCFLIYFLSFFAIFLLWHFTIVLLLYFPSYFWSCVSFLRHASTSRPATLSHSCVWLHHWALQEKNNDITGYCACAIPSYSIIAY